MFVGTTCDGKTRPALSPSDCSCSLSRPNRANRSSCADSRAVAQQIITAAAAILLRRANGGSGKVSVEDRSEVLPGTRAPDGAPLAHADAVPVAVATNDEAR